jgi:hypothetical protein
MTDLQTKLFLTQGHLGDLELLHPRVQLLLRFVSSSPLVLLPPLRLLLLHFLKRVRLRLMRRRLSRTSIRLRLMMLPPLRLLLLPWLSLRML